MGCLRHTSRWVVVKGFVWVLSRAEGILPMRYLVTDDGTLLEDERRSGWQIRLRTSDFAPKRLVSSEK
jgi:hypothetical protein